jgi:serine/threonine protein kinase
VQVELMIVGGRDLGRTFVLRLGQQFDLGRGREVVVMLDDDRVSRRHASVELRADGLFVTDLGSRNGTLLAGRQLPPNVPTQVADGDLLELGNHKLQVHLTPLDEKARRERQRTLRLDQPLLPADEFELLGELGRGATGRVYAARQKLLDRMVAIKVLHTECGDEPESRGRFLREGRVCIKIASPFVVAVHDMRLVDRRAYLIMELVHGPSVKDRLQSGALGVGEGLRVAHDVARALEATHALGVVHRDVKPANILLVPDGHAKLSDFGIAKELDSLESLTSTGDGLGTLAYVSPEQATDAKTVGPATDLYGLGATLYHMLAGQPPFTPRSVEVLMEIIRTPPPLLLTRRPDCPPDLASFVHRLMAKDPAHRPATARFVAERLAELEARVSPPRPVLGSTQSLPGDDVAELRTTDPL